MTEIKDIANSSSSNHVSLFTPTERIPTAFIFWLLTTLCLLRVLVGFHPHSGQGDDHGGGDDGAAYGGDFEAQRHWMELTINLPISEWYVHDLSYWGLDYPPLTAYVSWLCGQLSKVLVGSKSVALGDSRGYEDSVHKAFMRSSVLVLDVMVYFPAVWVIAGRLYRKHPTRQIWSVAFALAQPALLLIDHGHFQYNAVSLGLSLWSFHFMTKDAAVSVAGENFRNCVLGSFFFCMALNFKQMALYYAPAVFSYLLGRCAAAAGDGNGTFRIRSFLERVFILGMTVVLSFVSLWWPFFVYVPTTLDYVEGDVSGLKSVVHVVKRLFPFQRGLFEGKVSNLWCALSTKPMNIRNRIPANLQPMCALILTLAIILTPCVRLFGFGKGVTVRQGANPIHRTLNNEEHLFLLLMGGAITSLAFFLGSFQVHEKAILMTLSPISLLTLECPEFVSWFSLVSAWTLFPLMRVDKLEMAYLTTCLVFIVMVTLYTRSHPLTVASALIEGGGGDSVRLFRFITHRFVVTSTLPVMLSLHIAEITVNPPPATLPDIFPVLWSVAGCSMFCWSYLWCMSKISMVARGGFVFNAGLPRAREREKML